MAGAPNPDLFDFIESLEREEQYLATTAAAPNYINIDDTISDSSSIISNRDSHIVDVWQDIATALNNWTQRILNVESRCNNKAFFCYTRYHYVFTGITYINSNLFICTMLLVNIDTYESYTRTV